MDEAPIFNNENREGIYSEEEFIRRFNNFHLIFIVDNPEYLPKIKQFIQIDYPAEFKELRIKFKKDGDDKVLRERIIRENVVILYRIYLALRQKGNFSNQKLGLQYW